MLLLIAVTTAGMDDKDLDNNVVAKMILGFALTVNLT